MFLFADSESDAEGEPARLSEQQLAEQVRQSREKLADQTHPHEARAKELVNNQSRRDNSAEEHMDIDESRIRKENRRDERVRHVRFENTYNERRSNTTEEEGQGDYSEMETEGKGLELESCPYGCPYKSSDTWLIKAHLTRCPNKDSQSGTGEMPMTMQNQFAKHMVKSHTREVKAMVDDNLNILCKARFWPTPASLQALYAAMPSKAEPVRHNYNYSECGLTVNNVKVIIKLHDRLNTALSLNMFTNAALAKHETNRSWKPGRDPSSMLVDDEFAEIKQVQEAMEALNNLRVIFNQIWPLDGSIETLWNVVWKQMFVTAYQPHVEDISELFAYWLQDRAQAAMETRPPMTFFHLQSYMNNICQRRVPAISSETLFRKTKEVDETPYKRIRKGIKSQFNSGYSRDFKSKIVKQVDDITCRKFNSAIGCSQQVGAGGACISRGGRWMHLCNMLDNSTGKLCLKPHPVSEHK